MKKIHFDNMNNWIWIAIPIFSVVLILIGFFELIEFENSKIIKSIGALGFGLFAAHSSKMFWYKNYVQWNKKGTLIKINSFLGTTLNFNQIKTTELVNKNLTITKLNGNQVTFDLNNITDSDAQKLNDLIVKNAVVKAL
jgi:hypothetical protein